MALTKATYSMVVGAAANVLDFGAVGDGVMDDTSAIQAAFDSGAIAVYLPDGVYNVSSQLTISSVVHFYGPGTINETTLLDATILVDNVDGVRIEGITFIGPETLAAWNAGGAGYRQAFKAFIKFDTCKNGVVRDVISSGKRGVVWLANCQKMQIDSNRHDGFLGNIASPVSDANYYACYNVQGGRENHLSNNEAYSCGSVVLCGLESAYNVITNTTGRESHDNFIYNSSGDYSTFIGGTFENGAGSGLKIRGRAHTISGFTIKNCGTNSASISLTGNGTTPDAFGANGFGTVCCANTIIGSTGHAISVSDQDGLLPRDFIVSNNTIEAHTGTAGFAAIIVNGEQGHKVVNNIVRGSTANYAVAIFGVTGNRATNFDVSGNSVSSAVQAIRLSNVDDSIISGNLAFDISGGNAIEARLCDNNLAINNVVPAGTALRFSSTAGQECYNNVITVNKATISASGVDNTVANNY